MRQVPEQRLHWTEVDVRPPPSKQPRCALLEGFSPHATTHLHANDRQGLEWWLAVTATPPKPQDSRYQ